MFSSNILVLSRFCGVIHKYLERLFVPDVSKRFLDLVQSRIDVLAVFEHVHRGTDFSGQALADGVVDAHLDGERPPVLPLRGGV